MKKVILDTSFILTCIRQKIDFFEELEGMGLRAIVPKEVIVELEGVDKTGLSLKLIKANKHNKIDLKTKNVDAGIIKYANKNSDVFVATLDRGIAKKIPNSRIVIRQKKRLEVR